MGGNFGVLRNYVTTKGLETLRCSYSQIGSICEGIRTSNVGKAGLAFIRNGR